MDTQGSGIGNEPRRRGPLLAVLLALAGLALVAVGGWRHSAAGGAPVPGAVPVVVAARALDAGAVVGEGDVDLVRLAGSDAVSTLAHAPADVVGKRLAVAVPPSMPLSTALLSSAPLAAAGRRLVRLGLDASAMPPDLSSGRVADVVAAVPDGGDGGRVLTVATARVVDVAGGSSPVATLDVDTTGAARILWAQTFAKSLRLLVRAAADDSPPPDVGGLGP